MPAMDEADWHDARYDVFLDSLEGQLVARHGCCVLLVVYRGYTKNLAFVRSADSRHFGA